jgi:hypothetical protein
MKKYNLVLKDGEIINTIPADDLTSAISIFSTKKQLYPEQLLEIYNVIESEEGNTGNA